MDEIEYKPEYDVDFNRIKIAFKAILIIGILIITFSLISSLVRASETDLIYTPTNDLFFEADPPIYDEQFNIRNQTEYTGVYNATYSFTEEVDGTSGLDIDFIDIDDSSVDCEVRINNSIDGHDKVLEMFDNNGAGRIDVYTTFIARESGTIEFYVQSSDVTNVNDILISDAPNTGLHFSLRNDFLRYYDGAWHDIVSATDNTWYHVKLDFECANGGYLGLAPDTFFATINGIQYGAFDFRAGIDEGLFFELITESGTSNYYFYIDAVGYSWDVNYSIGDNIIPLINTLEINEVDKWEFALQSTDVLNPVGLDDPNGWTDYEQSGDLVNINTKSTNDRIVHMFSATFDFGLGKTDFFEADDYIYDISWSNSFFDSAASLVCLQSMKIYSNDSTLVVDINVYLDNSPIEQKLQYYDGSSYIDLETNPSWFSGFTYITYELYINYYDGVAVLRFYNTTEWSSSYLIPLIDDSKAGLGEIRFRQTDNGGLQYAPVKLDYIGVYVSGKSISDELAWKSIDLPSDLSIHNNNLFNISTSSNGVFNVGNISLVGGSYAVGVSDFVELTGFKVYTFDFPRVFNFYSRYVSVVTDPYLIFYQVNYYDDPFLNWVDTRGLDIDYIIIEGAKLVEGSNEYPLIYTYSVGFTEPLDNYFYVGGSTLAFTLTCQNSNLEYIQANFDITNIPTVNRSVKTSVSLTGFPFLFGEGAFSVKFLDETTLSFVFTGGDKFSQIMPQDKVIDEFSFLITDDDRDSASGNTMTGVLKTIVLVYYPNLSISIITTDLLLMLIPLFVLILPPLALYKRFGYKVVIPMMMIMSIVSVAGGLIPYWMFFVLMFCFVSFILVQRRSEGGGFL